MQNITRALKHGHSLALDLSGLNCSGHLLSSSSVDRAAKRAGGSKDLLNGSRELNGEGLVGLSHGLGNSENIVELDVSVVLHILGLLSVSASLLEGFDDQWGSSGAHGDSALSVLHGDLYLNLDSLPLGGSLLDVFSDLLGRETNRTTLGGKSGSGSNFSSNNLHEHYEGK